MKRIILPVFILLKFNMLFAQSLFDEALEENTSAGLPFKINGYIKAAAFSENNYDEPGYEFGELALNWIPGISSGKAYSEIRFKSDNEEESEIEIREAYIDYYKGPVDFRFGQQIIAWGRADAVNPTDNLNPKNALYYSSNEDDRRIPNIMLKSSFTVLPFSLDFVFIPHPIINEGFIEIEDDNNLSRDRAAFAIKLDIELASAEGSVSYFNGNSTEAGHILPGNDYKSFHQQVFGLDFSSTIGSYFGIRGEAAYKYRNTRDETYIAKPEYDFLVGLDKDISEFSIIIQYHGKYIEDFDENSGTGPNAVLFQQTEEYQSEIIARLAQSLFHENLLLEVLGSYNFDTEEIFIKYKTEIIPADNFKINCGISYIQGPDSTRADFAEDYFNLLFIETTIYF